MGIRCCPLAWEVRGGMIEGDKRGRRCREQGLGRAETSEVERRTVRAKTLGREGVTWVCAL